ncbi:MAG: PD40 domain-containing protein [Cytophagales bacterium]|nr:PD40 domain-containing protein [Armatimonadota bacterium]
MALSPPRSTPLTVLVTVLLTFLLLPAICCHAQAPKARSITLRIGEAVRFADGKVTRKRSEGDLTFRYLLPQTGNGQNEVNPVTRRLEYRSSVRTTECLPLIAAQKSASFKTPPDLSRMTVGDVNRWTETEYGVATGRYLLVRGYTDNRDYLLRVTRLYKPLNDPESWRISFTYKPVKLALGAAGAAGKSLPVKGTLTYQEWMGSKKVLDLNLGTGQVKVRFDGFAPSCSRSGETVYVDRANRVFIIGPDGRERASFAGPRSEDRKYTWDGAQDAVISPDGQRIAFVVDRSKMITAGGRSMPGVARASVVVLDRNGTELALFHEKKYPAWTPEGRLVAAEYGGSGICLSDQKLSRLEPIPGTPELQRLKSVSGISVSPDGKRLAFSYSARLWVVNLDGTKLRQLTRGDREESTPVWSPDGQFIAMRSETSMLGNDRLDIVRVADGKTITAVDAQGNSRTPVGRISWR